MQMCLKGIFAAMIFCKNCGPLLLQLLYNIKHNIVDATSTVFKTFSTNCHRWTTSIHRCAWTKEFLPEVWPFVLSFSLHNVKHSCGLLQFRWTPSTWRCAWRREFALQCFLQELHEQYVWTHFLMLMSCIYFHIYIRPLKASTHARTHTQREMRFYTFISPFKAN